MREVVQQEHERTWKSLEGGLGGEETGEKNMEG